MRKLAVSDNELIHLFDMCIDAEQRCEQRCFDLRAKGEYEKAAYEAQLRDKYAFLKNRIFEAMRDEAPKSSLAEIVQHLARIREPLPDLSDSDASPA
jgi:hypothetical protein